MSYNLLTVTHRKNGIAPSGAIIEDRTRVLEGPECGVPLPTVWRCVKPSEHDGAHAFEVHPRGFHDHGYYVDGCRANVFPMVDERNQDWD